MPVTKRPRGATAIRSDQMQLPQMRLPRINLPGKHVLAGAAIIALMGIAIILMPPSEEHTDQQSGVEAPVHQTENRNAEPDHSAEPDTTEPVAAAPQQPPWVEQSVKSGDNLSLIFKRAGYNDRDVHNVVSQATDGKSLGRIFPGQSIYFQADEAGKLLCCLPRTFHVCRAEELVVVEQCNGARRAGGFDR